MDLVLANVLRNPKKETFEGDTKDTFTIAPVHPVIQVIGALIGGYAAYLSWSCNTMQGIEPVAKVIYAVLAFFFGSLYLLLYWLFRSPCRPLGNQNGGRRNANLRRSRMNGAPSRVNASNGSGNVR